MNDAGAQHSGSASPRGVLQDGPSGCGQPAGDVRHELLRQFALGGARQRAVAFGIHQQQGIVVPSEGLGADVADQQGHTLARALGRGVLQQVVAFGREAYAVERPFARTAGGCDGRQDVGVLHEGERRDGSRAVLLDLARGGFRRAPVRDGSRRHEDGRLRGERGAGLQHVPRGAHVHAAHATRGRQVHGAGDQIHLGARLAGRTRDGEPHLAARQVGDAAHRVDRLESRAGRDQHAVPREQPGREEGRQFLQQFRGLQHAAIARFAAGLVARAHAQHHGAVGSHLRQVALRGGVRPHLAVHRGREQQRNALRGAGQAQQAEQLVGAALRQPGDEIGAAGGDQDRIRLAAQVDVRHVVGLARVPLRGIDRAARERLHGDGRDEPLGRLGHDHLHGGARLGEQARQLGRFVAGDAARKAQENVFARQFVHGRAI